MMNKSEFCSKMVADGMQLLGGAVESCDIAVDSKIIQVASMCIASMANTIYDMVYNPELEMKVARSKEAKQFPLMHFKKDGDVGYDLPCIIDEDPVLNVREYALHPHEQIALKTGIFVEIPKGYWIEIKARSGTGALMVITPDAVIDQGYRGEIFPVLMNIGQERVILRHGERYVQIVLHKKCNDNLKITEIDIDDLAPSERGSTGFGSTGR